MDTITLSIILPAITITASPFIGMLIAKMAKEEMKTGRKWLNFLMQALFITAVFVFMLAFRHLLWHTACAAAVIAMFLLFREFRNQKIVWFLFAIGFAMLAGSPFFSVFAGLLFLYGLPAGSASRPFMQSIIFFCTYIGLYYL